MAKEFVTIAVGSTQFSTWERVEVGAGAKAARSFRFEAAEPDDVGFDDWPLAPDNPCSVYASGDLIVMGYIEDYEPAFDPNSHRATISGRSKAADAIDSSALHPTGCFEGKHLGQIMQELDQFGIGYQVKTQLDTIPMHQLVPGATVHQEGDVLARAAGVLMIGNADGSVNITTASEFGRHAGALVEGVNFKSGSAKLSTRHKNSEVHVKGQARRGHGAKNLRIHKVAKDQTVKRYRPKLIVHEGDCDDKRAQKRADWHVARQSGREVQATITLYGWRDQDGALWDPQKLIYVESPKLKIDQDMAIQNLTFHQGESGTFTKLELVDPQALGGKNAKGKSNGAWATATPKGSTGPRR